MKIIDSSFTSPRSSNFTPYQDLNDTGLFIPFITRAWNSVVCLKNEHKEGYFTSSGKQKSFDNNNNTISIDFCYCNSYAGVRILLGKFGRTATRPDSRNLNRTMWHASSAAASIRRSCVRVITSCRPFFSFCVMLSPWCFLLYLMVITVEVNYCQKLMRFYCLSFFHVCNISLAVLIDAPWKIKFIFHEYTP